VITFCLTTLRRYFTRSVFFFTLTPLAAQLLDVFYAFLEFAIRSCGTFGVLLPLRRSLWAFDASHGFITCTLLDGLILSDV
jgi:hypothetical protein